MDRAALLFLLVACELQQIVLADQITVKEGIVAGERSRGAEPEINLLQPLSQLNRVTFGKTVLEASNNGVERWVVLFCLSWYEPCEALERPFAAVGVEWQKRLNTNLFSTEVRFATVDCATDKVFCNEQMVYEFPKIVLYHEHSAISVWSGGGGYTELASSMRRWTGQQLGALANARAETAEDDEDVTFLRWATVKMRGRNDLCFDIFVIVLAMLGNAWVVTRNPDLKQAKKTSCMALDGRSRRSS